MKVSIIDNSLCDSSFVREIRPEEIQAYMKSLHEFGVSYVEMTTDTFIMLPPASDMSKVILHMTSVRDLLYINSFNFAYVVVPAQFTDLVPKIERPVISEIYLHGGDAIRAMEMFEKNFELDNVAMIRFVDDFRETPQEMAALIREYRNKYFRPIDICPTNRYANAVNEAVAAVIAKTDSLTMRFGGYEYAELQDYTISLATLFGVAPSPQMILALYKCGCIYAMIYGRRAQSALDDLRAGQISPHYVQNIDRYKPVMPNERTMQSSYVRPPKNEENNSGKLLYKKLRSMMVDAKTAEELSEEIDEFCTQLYNKCENKKS